MASQAAASQASNYSFLSVKREGRKPVNIQGKTVNLVYY